MELQEALEILRNGRNTEQSVHSVGYCSDSSHTYLDNPEVDEVKHAVDVVESLAKQEGLSPSHINQLMVFVVKREGGGKASECQPHLNDHAKKLEG